jgi:quercetin dioxygenase-like cupin family protein
MSCWNFWISSDPPRRINNGIYHKQTCSVEKGTTAMNAKFVPSSTIHRETLEWGVLGSMSRPSVTGARNLTVLEVTLSPGAGHTFHKHPDQEEVIVVVEGEAEQWLEREKRTLRPGDSAFIGAGVVHASFNVTAGPIKLLAILGPCVGADGYETIDMSEQEPYHKLR